MMGSPYSLIVDESTDVSCTRELAVVQRSRSRNAGECTAPFLALVPSYDASADGLFPDLKALLSNCDLDLRNCVGLERMEQALYEQAKNVKSTRNSAENLMFPLLSELAVSFLSLPISSATVERVFIQSSA
ncbi:hypothetical protein HPB48_006207 [Haemaphysalis longicornis]|uniref:HAT C-terminal dimerisation domain-containing protein n=1 Tax=Haemaphysalis longicornis TaxID=44386 RepID=A0A9J6FT42_HAELO|nr:hypothetical protein HPB48_006207 [Haemaphysalis longicornis]